MYSSVCQAGQCFGFSFGLCATDCMAPGTWTSRGEVRELRKDRHKGTQTEGHDWVHWILGEEGAAPWKLRAEQRAEVIANS